MTKHNSKNRAYNNLVRKYKRQGLSEAKAIGMANHVMSRGNGYLPLIPAKRLKEKKVKVEKDAQVAVDSDMFDPDGWSESNDESDAEKWNSLLTE